jgi:tRNA (guanine-N7-)-methyltransferase
MSGDNHYTPNPTPYTLYGRRKGRKLRVQKAELMQTLLPQISIATGDEPLSPEKLFPNAKDVWLEIGFGGGEHLAAEAERNPQIGFIGCEPFVNGVASLVELVHQKKLQNVRVHASDARPLLDRLTPSSISCCFVLFADPWPKKRHAERRFISPANLEKLARIMKKGAELRLASDDPTLQAWMLEQMTATPFFTPQPGLLKEKPADWLPTRYEQKALRKKHVPFYYAYARK